MLGNIDVDQNNLLHNFPMFDNNLINIHNMCLNIYFKIKFITIAFCLVVLLVRTESKLYERKFQYSH